jgi:hypothetical protein
MTPTVPTTARTPAPGHDSRVELKHSNLDAGSEYHGEAEPRFSFGLADLHAHVQPLSGLSQWRGVDTCVSNPGLTPRTTAPPDEIP